ncbi:MAG: hypothetical protein EXR29_07725 [Betaproteobacteria bacterium]|nr:hypothetical protein [Betaproteobacteria bacterium]
MTMKSPAGLSGLDEDKLLSILKGVRRGAYVIGRPVPMLKRIVKPDLSWEAATPGLVFPVLEYKVSELHVSMFRKLLGGHGLSEQRRHSATVPPAFFVDEPMQCIVTLFGRSGRLHASHSMEAFRSVPIDATIRSRAKIIDRYELSGRKFVDVECTVCVLNGDNEDPAIRIVATLIP